MKNIYLFLLADLVGVEIALGAFVAPVIFFPQKLIGEGVRTHFQSGIMMTQIFIKYNYVLLGISALAFAYEAASLRGKESFGVRISGFMLSFINLSLALLFVFYFTDFIVAAQAAGQDATIGNAEFDAMHKASEWAMKMMMIAQTALFFLRSYKKLKAQAE